MIVITILKASFSVVNFFFLFLLRIEHGFEVRPDLCQTACKINPREFLGKFWVDSLVHDEKALKYVVEVCGADKVMLGSDYPFPCMFLVLILLLFFDLSFSLLLVLLL